MRLPRLLAPLLLVAAVATACGGSSSSSPGASSGFEVRTVYARYAPGVPFGPQLPQALVQELSSQHCPMKPRIVQGYLMECDTGQTVYLLNKPIVKGDIQSATPRQIGRKNIWYVEVKLDSSVVHTISSQLSSMTGEQLAFSYNGSVLTSIAIDSSFHPGNFAITGNYNQASATKLAHELSG